MNPTPQARWSYESASDWVVCLGFAPPFYPIMDKELERSFLETLSKGLISLPFDLKVLLEAVSDADGLGA